MPWVLFPEIVRLIREKKADYVLTLKSNHPTLYSQVKDWFNVMLSHNFEGVKVSHDRRVEKGHHRREKRLVWAVPISELGGLYKQEQWERSSKYCDAPKNPLSVE